MRAISLRCENYSPVMPQPLLLQISQRGGHLAVRLAVPLIGPAKVFHLLGLRPAGRTNKKAPSWEGAW